MGTYLLKTEEIEVKVENPSWLILLSHIIFTVLTLGIWAPILIYYILRRATTRYIITNQRIIWEYGILSKTSKESPLDKINNVSHEQSLVGRMFNYGDVQLQTASEMGATIFKFISAPIQFKSEVVNQIDHFKKSAVEAQATTMAKAMAASTASSSQTVAADTKECPNCAETIKAAAKVCRFCNYKFETS